MNIEDVKVGDKFTKYGEVVEVFSIDAFKYNHIGVICTISDIVIFGSSCKISDAKILTKRDFLEQYKPYKIVYEWQWCTKYNGNDLYEATEYYTDEEIEKHVDFEKLYIQRLDFTKRERKL